MVETSTLTEEGVIRVKTEVSPPCKQACPFLHRRLVSPELHQARREMRLGSLPPPRPLLLPCECWEWGSHSHHGSSPLVLPPWFLHWAGFALTQEGR